MSTVDQSTETNATQSGAASTPEKKYKTDLHKIWPSGRAFKIQIHKNSVDGSESGATEAGPFRLGLLPEMTIRRGVQVIVPMEILGVIQDCEVKMPKQSPLVSGGFSKIYEESYTRFPFTNYGEVSWNEFEDFILAERKKPTREEE